MSKPPIYPSVGGGSPITGVDQVGNPIEGIFTPQGAQHVEVRGPLTAFGELLIASITPVIQMRWSYQLSPELNDSITHLSGTVEATAGGELKVSTGITAGGFALNKSRQVIEYYPGQGVDAKFTARFLNPVAGGFAVAGVIDEENGFGVGYDGTTFGFLHRSGGQLETRKLAITAAATGSGNVTVQLNDGVGVLVAVTIGDTIAEISRKIADADFTQENGGWDNHDGGGSVVFHATKTDARAGAYSFTDTGGTGVTATFSILASAVAADDDWTVQEDWSDDKANNTGILPLLDPVKGNVWRVVYQWLAYGPVWLFMEHPEDGHWVLANLLPYANANTKPSIRQPNLHMSAIVDNGGDTTDVQVFSGSMAAGVYGETITSPHRHSKSVTATGITAEEPIFSIRSKLIFKGLTNRIRAIIDGITIGNESTNKLATFRVYKNAGLIGTPSWSDIATDSVIEIDSSATGITNGEEIFSFTLGAAEGKDRDLSERRHIVLEAGDIITVTGAISSTAPLVGGLSWTEGL